MQATSVLGDGPSPRDRKRKKQRVQPRIVESFSYVFAGCQNHPGVLARDGCEPIGDGLPLLLAHPRSQDDEVTDTCREPSLEAVEVIVALGENEWGPAAVHRIDDVVADATVA